MELSTESLAEYALEVSFDELPSEVVDRTKRLFIDSIGVAVGTYAEPPIKALRREYSGLTGREDGATILGTRDATETSLAGLINASMVRYLDFNDAYIGGLAGCHPSDHIGSLVSVAEAEGATGRELIEAIVVAYEIQCRGIDTMKVWEQGFDYVVWGGQAHAAAAGKLMGLTKEELRNAIGIVATSNNGILAARMGDVSMWKGLAQPYAQHNAIQACTMARRGITGPTDVFEVPDGGVFDAIADGRFELDAMGGRDADYKILETAIKAYPCGYGTHPAVSGMLGLRQEHGLRPEQVKSINVRVIPSYAKVYATPERWDPQQSRESADHSIPYCIAVALTDGEMTRRQFSTERLRDSEVHALMDKIDAEPDEKLQEAFTEDPRRVHTPIEVVTAEDTYTIRPSTAPGHPDEPLSADQLEGKFEQMTESFLSDDERQEALDYCYSLDELDRVGVIVDSLAI
jgi:2-methylcitrate dehydratase